MSAIQQLLLAMAAAAGGGAMPTFQAAGTPVSSDIASISPAWPTHLTNDIALMFVESANETITLTDAQGFVEVTDSPQGIGPVGVSSSTLLACYWRRASSSSMVAPTIADSGDHTQAVIVTFRGVTTSGNPWDVTAGDTAASSTSISAPGDTTTVANCLVVIGVSNSIDNAVPQASGWANADLANLTERVDVNVTVGAGSGISVVTGEKATAGAFGVTTGTLDTASQQGRIVIALKP